ncbi:16703_t:CDS:2 [Funneliformis caledonium]|uniref:16703_t:CDS:1 n=1 Tax=Funneliformis caledonium TaxID=1117310 RepID=A0A9N9E9I3_9GLOM|nr:16703_t:CDS:2 [Funneliformis caledonium]
MQPNHTQQIVQILSLQQHISQNFQEDEVLATAYSFMEEL